MHSCAIKQRSTGPVIRSTDNVEHMDGGVLASPASAGASAYFAELAEPRVGQP